MVDGSTVVRDTAGATNDYLTIPGTGEVLVYYQTGTGNSWVPFHDASGSTVALDSTGLTNQYTYDPDGMPWVVTGPQNLFAFLYDGMRFEPDYLYDGGGRFYSPILQRSPCGTGSESPERAEAAVEAGPARVRQGRAAASLPAEAIHHWVKRGKPSEL
jgi:hypothetical protein